MSKCMPNFNMKPEIDAFCNSSISLFVNAYFETPKHIYGFTTLFQTGLLLVIRDVDPFHENKKHINSNLLFITRSFKITSTAVTFKCPTSSQGQ